MKKISLVILCISVLSEALSAEATTVSRPLSYGIVYPSMSLAVKENPAILAIDNGDQVEVFYGLPVTYNKSTGGIDPVENAKPSPMWISYGGSPKPFGIGFALERDGNKPKIHGGAGFGIEKFQLGYILSIDPIADLLVHHYAFRIGANTGPAAAIVWADKRSVTGIGYHIGWFTFEVDNTLDLEFEADPVLSVTLGFLAPRLGVNIGYSPESLKKLEPRTQLIHAALHVWITDNWGLNIYYKQLFQEFVVGITAKF